MHDKLIVIQEAMNELLNGTIYDAFRIAYQEDGLRPTKPRRGKTKRKRRTYRSTRST